MKKYAAACRDGYGLLTSKFIIIPGINDNRSEIDSWMNTVAGLGCRWLALDIEDNWYKNNRNNIPDYYLDIVNYVINRSHAMGMKIELYDRARGLKEGKN